MTVQRIDSDARRTHGWQARQYTQAPRYISAFFSDKTHGGSDKAKALAEAADQRLQREARKA